MCDKCIARWKRQFEEAKAEAMIDLDARGCPDDALVRRIVECQLAMNNVPQLRESMMICYPTAEQLMS